MKQEFSLKNLVKFTVPNILVGTIEPLASLVDTYFTAQLSVSHLAALAANVALFSAFGWIFSFINHLSVNKMARSANNPEAQKSSFWNGNVLSLISAILCIFILLIFRNEILLNIFALKPETAIISQSYYNIRLYGFLFFFLSLNYLGALKGLEKVKLAFLISLSGTFFNILISFLLFNFHEKNLSSLAIGTVLEYVLLSLISLYYFHKHSQTKFFQSIKIDLSFLGQSLVNAKNIFLRTLLLTTTFLSTSILLSKLDETYLATHQIMLEIWLYLSIIFDGVASTAQIKIGKYSHGSKDDLRFLVKQLMKISLISSLILICILLMIKSLIIENFIISRSMHSLFDQVWLLFVLFQIINSFAYIYDGILYGFENYAIQRNLIFVSVLIGFIPFAIVGYVANSFLLVWSGLMGMNFLRAIIGGLYLKNKYFKGISYD